MIYDALSGYVYVPNQLENNPHKKRVRLKIRSYKEKMFVGLTAFMGDGLLQTRLKDNRKIRYSGWWSLFLGYGLGYGCKILHGPKYLSDGPHGPPDRLFFTEKNSSKFSFKLVK